MRCLQASATSDEVIQTAGYTALQYRNSHIGYIMAELASTCRWGARAHHSDSDLEPWNGVG